MTHKLEVSPTRHPQDRITKSCNATCSQCQWVTKHTAAIDVGAINVLPSISASQHSALALPNPKSGCFQSSEQLCALFPRWANKDMRRLFDISSIGAAPISARL
jgi:hypothetical protein